MRRSSAIVLISLFFLSAVLLSAVSIGGIISNRQSGESIWGRATADMSGTLRNIPVVSDIVPDLFDALGHKVQNGVYITDNMLIEEFAPADINAVNKNTESLHSFIDKLSDWYNELNYSGNVVRRMPVFFMIAPTACEIKSAELPPYTYMVDQKSLINDVYYQSDLQGAPLLNPIRAYDALFRASGEYIYHRTESTLTGLGGYYLYVDAANTMRIEPKSIGRFNMTNYGYDYIGDLSDRVNSSHIKPDLVSVYSYADSDNEYRVIHYSPEGQRYYSGLYQEHMLEIASPNDVVLGGISPRIDIVSSGDLNDSLLIVTDDIVKSYISFLAVHFKNITILDISTLDATIAQDVDVSRYGRILVSVSLDNYAHNTKLADALDLLYYRILPPKENAPVDLIQAVSEAENTETSEYTGEASEAVEYDGNIVEEEISDNEE